VKTGSIAPAGWIEASLEDFCVVIQGQSPPGETYNITGDGLPFFQGKAEFGELYPLPVKWCTAPAKVAEKDDILISIRAPVGPTNICRSTACIGRGLAAIRPLGGVNGKYVLYGLRLTAQELLDESTGSTFDAISGQTLRRHTLPVAPVAEQSRIVAEIEKQFTRLDAAVSALKRVQANLKRYRASVLKAACGGRLVPTEAELARRERRSYEPASRLLDRILAERCARWETTQLATKKRYKTPEKINESDPQSGPDGWTYATLDQLTSKIVDGTHFTPTYVPNGVPFLSVKDVHDDSVSFEDCKFIRREEHELLSKRCNPEKGDLLVTKSGTIGRSAIIEVDTQFSLFVSVALLKPATSEVSMRWLALAIQNWIRTIDIQQDVKGSALKNLHLEDFRRIKAAIPPNAEQVRIIAEVDRHWSLIRYLEELLKTNLRKSEKLRQTILKSAFEGKLVPQDPNDEPASILLEGIRATADLGRARPTTMRPTDSSRKFMRSKETADV